MDARKRKFLVKLKKKKIPTAVIKIQSFWRTVPKPQLRLAQIEVQETQLVVGGTANDLENSMGSGSSAIPPLGGEADKEPPALGGEADNDLRNSNQGSDLVGGGTGKDLQEPPLGGEADIAQIEVQETQLVVGGTANDLENSMGSGSSAIPPLGGEADNDSRNSNQGSDLVGGGTGKDLQEPPLGGEAGNDVGSSKRGSDLLVQDGGQSAINVKEPRLPVRYSRRLSRERMSLLQQKCQPKKSSSSISASQVGRLLVSSAGTWFSVSECGKRQRLDLEFVNINFRKKFINKCLQHREKNHTVDAGAPRDISPAIMTASLSPITHPIVRYPQMGRETCVMSSFASALSHFNDPNAERIMASAISSSEMAEDRFVFLVDLLNSSNLKFRVKKYKNRVLNILDDFSCFPTVIRLAGKDGSLCHSVTTAGKWLFDSNLSHARQISLPLLDWCCSSDTVSSQFSHVAFALRLTAEKPRPEWNLCRGCKDGGLCIAGM
jgi:hypothetical protein